ncbi:MAG: VWA domain-containing protein [Microbacterium sp.]
MSVEWPWVLAALPLAAVIVLAGWWLTRRRRRDVVVVSTVAFARAAGDGGSWLRRLPAVLLALALVVLGIAAARPQMLAPVASGDATVVLAMDVSGSMCSTDVEPNRLTAAQDAAIDFVTGQPADTSLGLVTFSSFAALTVAPTTDTDELVTAIEGLTTSRGTAIGMAILAAIDAIAEVNPNVAPTGVEVDADADVEMQPDTIIVLTDGANSEGVEPVTAAEQAAARGLRVYTIGFGTDEPGAAVCSADQVDSGTASSGGGSGGGPSQQIDEDTLTQVAELTGGEYFRAQDAAQLQDVLETQLGEVVTVTMKQTEVTVWFALGGAALALAGLGGALWLRRPREKGRRRVLD